MLLIAFTIFVTIFLSIFVYNKHGRQLQLTKKLPGPKGLPLIGNGLDLIYKSPVEFIQILSGYMRDYGNHFTLWLANQLVYYTHEPKDIEVILTSPKLISKSDEYDFFKPWLGTGLLIARPEKWHGRRKAITPTFHFKILEQFVEVFDNQSNIFMEKLKAHSDKEAFDVFPMVTLCALDIICETAMGIHNNAQNDSESEYVVAVREISDIIHKRSYDFMLRYEALFQFTPTYQKQKKLLKILHEFTDKVIIERRQKLLESKETVQSIPSDEDFVPKKKMAFLDVLLQSTINGKPLTNMDIREEVDTFMFEGHDTTTSGIAFSLYFIAKYPEIQAKLFEEIRSVIGDDITKPVSLHDLNELHYMDLIIKETLRLYPSVPLFGRTVPEEMEINGKILPKDTNIIIGAYFMGRDPKIWENPEEFRPERFDVVKSADKFNPYSYIPFSAGQRNCIGQKFAMLEMKSTLSKFLRHYEISTPKDFKPIDILEIIVKSQNGIMLEIKERIYK